MCQLKALIRKYLESRLMQWIIVLCSRIVESVGEGVEDMKKGDHVIPFFQGQCGNCICCRNDKTNLCQRFGVNPLKNVMVNDGKTRFSTKDGNPIFHFLNTSTFSEYTVYWFISEELCIGCVCVFASNIYFDIIFVSVSEGASLHWSWCISNCMFLFIGLWV